MPAAAKLAYETERLQALFALNILESEQSAEFDVFPELTSRLFDVPVAAISLVDKDRQWFKASVGMTESETPIEHSFCAHAILNPDEILVVPDATKDPRFADNIQVTGEFGLRFYVGIPIIGPSGHPVGALCAIDHVPRQVTNEELEQLRLLAVGVSSALRLHASIVKLQFQADTDQLTGLLNRAGFERHARHAPPFAEGAENPVGLLVLGLDSFSSINDLFGHAGGDIVLREVADRLRMLASPAHLIGRFGGDEFCILVRNIRKVAELNTLATRIHAAFERPVIIENQPVPFTTSIGIATGQWNAESQSRLFQRADDALSQAKQVGRGITQFAAAAARTRRQAQDNRPSAGRSSMKDTLRQALVPAGHEPFTLALQPIHTAAGGTLTGFEALIRWPLPDGGVRLPNDFLPVAEASGLIVQLDRWVLNRACELAAAWPAHLHISSNLSAANFFAGNLVETVRDTLARHRLEPSRLNLEITETVLLHDRARVRAVVTALQAIGVRVILDDFGAGHASLAYLRDYPFDGLKIDRSFIAGLDRDSTSRPLIRAMIAMSRALGLETIAEGVETETQLTILREEGVDSVQGYLLGRPTAPEKISLLGSPARQPLSSRLLQHAQPSMA